MSKEHHVIYDHTRQDLSLGFLGLGTGASVVLFMCLCRTGTEPGTRLRPRGGKPRVPESGMKGWMEALFDIERLYRSLC